VRPETERNVKADAPCLCALHPATPAEPCEVDFDAVVHRLGPPQTRAKGRLEMARIDARRPAKWPLGAKIGGSRSEKGNFGDIAEKQRQAYVFKVKKCYPAKVILGNFKGNFMQVTDFIDGAFGLRLPFGGVTNYPIITI